MKSVLHYTHTQETFQKKNKTDNEKEETRGSEERVQLLFGWGGEGEGTQLCI